MDYRGRLPYRTLALLKNNNFIDLTGSLNKKALTVLALIRLNY